MKKTIIFFSIATLFFGLFSCGKEDSFSNLQKKETKTINAYIKENHIQVVDKMPSEWTENVYYHTPSGLYISIEHEGDTSVNVSQWTKAKVRYRTIEHELDSAKTVVTDHISSSHSSREPAELLYGDLSSYSSVGQGMYEAIGIMKNKGARAKLIVPSSLNTTNYSYNLKTIGYIVVITNIE